MLAFLLVVGMALVSLGWSEPALAGLSLLQIKRLGLDLTPVGAQRAGNGDDIPSWQGGLKVQPEFQPGDFHADPFAGDAPRFRINHTNIDRHRSRLTAGQIALLQRFPDLYFDVYPSHRSASYPDYVYQAIAKNGEQAQLMKYGSGVSGAVMSSPFPIPSSGLEVLWNHTLRFRGHSLAFSAHTAAVNSDGSRAMSLRDYRYYFRYSEIGSSADQLDNKIFYLRRKTLAPAATAGAITLVHETLDQVRSPRKSWLYVPGQRRLRRTPDLA